MVIVSILLGLLLVAAVVALVLWGLFLLYVLTVFCVRDYRPAPRMSTWLWRRWWRMGYRGLYQWHWRYLGLRAR